MSRKILLSLLQNMLERRERILERIPDAEEARRNRIYLDNEIEDLRFLINCNCEKWAIREIYKSTLSEEIKMILKAQADKEAV